MTKIKFFDSSEFPLIQTSYQGLRNPTSSGLPAPLQSYAPRSPLLALRFCLSVPYSAHEGFVLMSPQAMILFSQTLLILGLCLNVDCIQGPS